MDSSSDISRASSIADVRVRGDRMHHQNVNEPNPSVGIFSHSKFLLSPVLGFWILKKDALLCLSHPGLVEMHFVYIGQLSSPQDFTIAIDRAEETEPNS